jgi:uncharacterized protein YdhG (YjbR/CyaY superfamily)
MGQDAAVTAYIEALPPGTRAAMEAVMDVARASLPGAEEVIRYGIPTFQLGGRSVVHLGAWKEHLSVYPLPAGDEPLAQDLRPWVAGRGTLRFPLAEPLPLPLITRVVTRLRDAQADR